MVNTKKVAYVTNKDLLIEIQKSKLSYCSWTDDAYTMHDTIISSLEEITDERIEEERYHKALRMLGKRVNHTVEASLLKNTLEGIPPNSIVFCLITYGHIPARPIFENGPKETVEETPLKEIPLTKKGKPRKIVAKAGPRKYAQKKLEDQSPVHQLKTIYGTLPFIPFKHYIKDAGELKEVLRSHWKGGFDNGHYCDDHGQLTDNLVRMIMLMINKISYRGNFRNYSYIDEMQLSAIEHVIGKKICLKFEESRTKPGEQKNPFAYISTCVGNSFKRTLNEEKRIRELRDDFARSYGIDYAYDKGAGSE